MVVNFSSRFLLRIKLFYLCYLMLIAEGKCSCLMYSAQLIILASEFLNLSASYDQGDIGLNVLLELAFQHQQIFKI